MRRTEEAPIRLVVSSVIRRAGAQRRLEPLERLWRRVCGSRFAQHSGVVSCRRGVLVIRVDRSEWLYDMYGWKEAWLKRLKRHPAGRDVNELVLRVGQP